MWVGAASRKYPGSSGLHYDGYDNLNVLVRGEKRWRIYSPKDALLMDYVIPPWKVEANGYIHSVTDSLQSLFAHFGIEPRFTKAVTSSQGVDPKYQPRLQVRSCMHAR